MSEADELLRANTEWAAAFDRGGTPLPPKRRLAIVTCMDARILPSKVLGLEVGDAHIIRNAGGRASDALRSLVISQRLAGTTEVVVMHHTDCASLMFDNDSLRAQVESDLGAEAGAQAAEIDFLPFPDLDQSVRDDVAFLRSSPLIPRTTLIRGFIYDVRTGKLFEVLTDFGRKETRREQESETEART
jgi:carbonic anhydrase